ncbi:hypothetical protein BXY53_2129 [Dichotomicrobium thermohalophilum]|uniref:Uncharacterized protein n=1 Tax=Dichotomicrobium thermohalophilum TaxID=933063 RepID=A0A397PNG8_9HYPH|nr:hypothetical protein BXY53_2129 [Dichotomicrobium thermohalophilum]
MAATSCTAPAREPERPCKKKRESFLGELFAF